MSTSKVALVAGSTGLIGNLLINTLTEHDQYHQIKCLTRRPLDIQSQKIEEIRTDGDNLAELSDRLQADDIFCCLGTTIKKAGTKEAFRKVDFDYPLLLAKATRQQGASQYLLVSALGADPDSSVFYNRVKGEVERELYKVDFPSFHIFRPSLLLGERNNEKRFGEDVGKVFFKYFGFLVPKKYKAIDAIRVARAMVHMAKQQTKGNFIHESEELQKF
ncbi:MAG: oxidoreductase [Cyclobacteriaceae bacterium]|nr:oxidoreductase [Cyclobacteriaceae bacterium]